MDRTSISRLVNEFKLVADLTKPDGLLSASKSEKYIDSVLKPFVEAGKIMRSVEVNRATGTRTTTFGFIGNTDVRRSVEAALGLPGSGQKPTGEGLANMMGMEGDPSFTVSRIQGRKYTETTQRPLDARTSAAVMAEAVRLGGTAKKDRESGLVTTMIRADKAKRINEQVDLGDERYNAGLSASDPLSGSSPANIHERAYAAIARKDRMEMAKREAQQKFIKENPNSIIAQTATQKEKDEKDKESEGAARMAKGAVGAILSTMLGLMAVSVGLLNKILGGVLTTAASTTRMMADSARFNLSANEMTKFKGIARGMGYNEGEEPFSAMMGAVVSKYSSPMNAGTNIAAAAPFLEEMIGPTLSYITDNVASPDKVMDELTAKWLTLTAAGRTMQKEGLPMGEAASMNMPEADTLLGSGGGRYMSLLYTKLQNEGKITQGQSFTGEQVKRLREGMFLGIGSEAGTANAPIVDQVALRAAQDGAKSMNELGQIWRGLNDTVWTKMLGYISQIAELLRVFLRPLIASINPSWEANENRNAVTQNEKLSKMYKDQITVMSPALAPLVASVKDGDLKNGGVVAIGKELNRISDAYNSGDVNNATADLKKKFGMTPDQMKATIGNNGILFQYIRDLTDLESQKGAGVNAGLWSILGIGDLKGATQMSNKSLEQSAMMGADVQIAYRMGIANRNAALQAYPVIGEEPEDTQYSGTGLITNMWKAATARNTPLTQQISVEAAMYTSKDNIKKTLDLMANALAKNPALAPHQVASDLRGKVSEQDIEATTAYLKKRQGSTNGDAKSRLSDIVKDMPLLGWAVANPDFSVSGQEKLGGVQQGILQAAARAEINKRALDAMKVQLGEAAAQNIMAQVHAGTASEHFSSAIDGSVDLNFNITENGKTRTVTARVSTNGIALDGPGTMSGSGWTLDTVANSKSAAGVKK